MVGEPMASCNATPAAMMRTSVDTASSARFVLRRCCSSCAHSTAATQNHEGTLLGVDAVPIRVPYLRHVGLQVLELYLLMLPQERKQRKRQRHGEHCRQTHQVPGKPQWWTAMV